MNLKYSRLPLAALMGFLLGACGPDHHDGSRDTTEGTALPAPITLQSFDPNQAIVGCSCIMRLADAAPADGQCIYAEQVGMPERRFVLMQLDGQLLRFSVDSVHHDDIERRKETFFSGNGYRGHARFAETDRTEPEARLQSGTIAINHDQGAALEAEVAGMCGC